MLSSTHTRLLLLDEVYQCSVLQIVVFVEKQLHNGMYSEKEELLIPANTDHRDLVHVHPLKIESDSPAVDFAAQWAIQQCNPFHIEPVALTPEIGFANSQMFWCNCEKEYIYPSRRVVVRRSRKIQLMQCKSISTTSANAFNAKNSDSLPFTIRWIHNCISRLNATMSRTHLKVITFSMHGPVHLFKSIKNHLRIAIRQYTAIDESFSKAMILFFQ